MRLLAEATRSTLSEPTGSAADSIPLSLLVNGPDASDRALRDRLFRYFRVHLRPEDAEFHWGRVLARHERNVRLLGSQLDLRTTAFDYFLESGLLREPVVLEQTSLSETEVLAYRDSLTGLYNHAHFESELRREVARSNRYGTSVCLLLVDLDDFKRVNDDYGHGVGNDVLRDVAGLLERGLRTGDLVARVGGDEFALLLHQADIISGVKVAARKRQAIEAWFHAQGSINGPRTTASLGLATAPSQAKDERGLFDAADRALYEAKKRGRNRLSFAHRKRLVCLGGSGSRRLSIGRSDFAPEAGTEKTAR